jgi:hypothetical protein
MPRFFMMIWLLFVLSILATWRITSLLVMEEGPFDMFARLRSFVGVQYDDHSNPYGENALSKIFSCVWCMSVWVALVVTVFSMSDPVNLRLFFLWWLSTSTGAILVNRWTYA